MSKKCERRVEYTPPPHVLALLNKETLTPNGWNWKFCLPAPKIHISDGFATHLGRKQHRGNTDDRCVRMWRATDQSPPRSRACVSGVRNNRCVADIPPEVETKTTTDPATGESHKNKPPFQQTLCLCREDACHHIVSSCTTDTTRGVVIVGFLWTSLILSPVSVVIKQLDWVKRVKSKWC